MAGAHHRTQGIEDSELLAETTSAAAPKQSVPQDQNNQCRSTKTISAAAPTATKRGRAQGIHTHTQGVLNPREVSPNQDKICLEQHLDTNTSLSET